MKKFDSKDWVWHYVMLDEITGDFEIKEKECNHVFELAKFKMTNGNYQLRSQCKNCYLFDGGAVSQKGHDMTKIIEAKDYWELKTEEYEMLKERLSKAKQKKRQELLRKYYKSEAWKEKRILVLRRDDYTCQSCLIQEATEVHHKSYRFLFNEPLFDLVSVCHNCHKQIHNMIDGVGFEDITHN